MRKKSILFTDDHKKDFRKNTVYLYLLLFLCFPIGLYTLHKTKSKSRKFKTVYFTICAIFVALLITVIVISLIPDKIEIVINESTINLEVGQSSSVNVGTSKAGFSYAEYEYISEDPDIASFEDGIVTAINPGSCEIYVTASGKTSNRVTVIVTEGKDPIDYARTVYITESGSVYHYDSSCSNMSNPISLTIDEAIKMGYSACKRCAIDE